MRASVSRPGEDACSTLRRAATLRARALRSREQAKTPTPHAETSRVPRGFSGLVLQFTIRSQSVLPAIGTPHTKRTQSGYRSAHPSLSRTGGGAIFTKPTLRLQEHVVARFTKRTQFALRIEKTNPFCPGDGPAANLQNEAKRLPAPWPRPGSLKIASGLRSRLIHSMDIGGPRANQPYGADLIRTNSGNSLSLFLIGEADHRCRDRRAWFWPRSERLIAFVRWKHMPMSCRQELSSKPQIPSPRILKLSWRPKS